jgi:hypothetical protein
MNKSISASTRELKQGYIDQINHLRHPDNKHRSRAFRHIIPLRPLYRHEIQFGLLTEEEKHRIKTKISSKNP